MADTLGQSKNNGGRKRFSRLLVANRGEIAARILTAARELSLPTATLSIKDDSSHIAWASHDNVNFEMSTASSYMSVDELVRLVKQHNSSSRDATIDAVHPGYGFLSESSSFAARMSNEAGLTVVGPGPAVLDRTGDKLQARRLAQDCGVPVLPAMLEPVDNVESVKSWMRHENVSLPIMIKALDGGGGRGIRLVRESQQLEQLVQRAIADSPSKQVFAESAAVDGFRHVEVQIFGTFDHESNQYQLTHFDTRECSIQRRYQKIVELAPAFPAIARQVCEQFLNTIIAAAMRMAREASYLSLGTWEFLAKPNTEEFYFLEVNPRLQVEHTITEEIMNVDLVKSQLTCAMGASLGEVGLEATALDHEGHLKDDHKAEPRSCSIQLRLCAENPNNNFTLSVGRVTSFRFPTGNGIRIETHLLPSPYPNVITSDFDSLIAKVIITAPTWQEAVSKARRALEDSAISGVQTNLDVLRAIVQSKDFEDGNCDTMWLEKHMSELIKEGKRIGESLQRNRSRLDSKDSMDLSDSSSIQGNSTSTVMLRKGDAWTVRLRPTNEVGTSSAADTMNESGAETHHLKLLKISRNELPSSLTASVLYSTPSNPNPQPVFVEFSSTSASAASATAEGAFRQGDRSNPGHVIIPFAGRLAEVLVEEGDTIEDDEVVAVVRQMKMELEVRAKKGGIVKWALDGEDFDVPEGCLVAEVDVGAQQASNNDDMRSKL